MIKKMLTIKTIIILALFVTLTGVSGRQERMMNTKDADVQISDTEDRKYKDDKLEKRQFIGKMETFKRQKRTK